MNKNVLMWVAIVVFSVASLGASAQSKLGYIESDKLISAMPEMGDAKTKLEAKQGEIEKEMTSLREQYQSKMSDYSQKVSTYSESVRSTKEQDLQDLVQRIQRFEEMATSEFKKAQEDLYRPIMDKATKAIQDVGKEHGFLYIFDVTAGSIIYKAEAAEDVLSLVKKKLGIKEEAGTGTGTGIKEEAGKK
ncbi:membrane protein [Bacteroidia bacterium]|nr:membrane protein [Bacteroidia bacterium]